MKTIRVVSGIAVLLTALHFAHAIHHFFSMNPQRGPGVWAGITFAVILDALAFVGGYLLLRPNRQVRG